MKITKLGHSCLLVEKPERTAIFDPGEFSNVDIESIECLDDIIITHEHPDHCDVSVLKQLTEKFPEVRVKTPASMVPQLDSISVTTEAVEGIEFFRSPHEGHPPFLDPPENVGIHYLGKLTHPGDSHSFTETKDILALPLTAPWGSADRAVQLALQLKPKYIIPIHDWHWKDVVRMNMYERLTNLFSQQGIKFISPQNGIAFKIDA